MTELSEKQKHILSSFLRFLLLLGGIAYVPSVIACIKDSLYLLAVIDTFAFAVVAIVAFHRRMPHHVRLWITVLVTLFIGGAVLFTTGNDGAGHLWLICSVVISSLFGNILIVIFTIALTEMTMLAYGIAVYFGIIESSVTVISLIAISSNLLVISIALSLIIHRLLQSLEEELESKEGLLRLLHHRVRNNLQTVESLIALEHGTDEGRNDSRLPRRVAAISAVNNLILSEPSDPNVLLQDLLQALMRPGIDRIEGESSVWISPEKASEMAVAFSDLLSIFSDNGPVVIDISHEKKVVFSNGKTLLKLGMPDDLIKKLLIHPEWLEVAPEANLITVHLPDIPTSL